MRLLGILASYRGAAEAPIVETASYDGIDAR